MKYLLPWKDYSNNNYLIYKRKQLGSIKEDEWFEVYRVLPRGMWNFINMPGSKGQAYEHKHPPEEVMAAADKYLVSAGYFLIPPDQAQRYIKKLILLI